MARLIQKSGYFKGGSTGYMKYIAQRDGVEITSDTGPVTEKQRQLIEDLLKNYPDAKELFEYEDYLTTPNRATASAYIAAALDSHLHEMEPESGYMKYIAQRLRAEKHGGHGLFSAAPVTDLNKAVAELDTHTGRVWTFIFSLRREDAVQTGYDNAAAWRELLLQQSGTLAEALRIPQDKLRWYAAFHDEGYHPHVHMMVWSDDPRMGHLTKKGIFAMRSKLTGTIFREELKDVYIRKESIYKRSIQTAQEKLLELTGAGPKLLSQLIRHQLIYREVLEGRYRALDAVEKYGYADQSHLLRDFRRFQGVLPGELPWKNDENCRISSIHEE